MEETCGEYLEVYEEFEQGGDLLDSRSRLEREVLPRFEEGINEEFGEMARLMKQAFKDDESDGVEFYGGLIAMGCQAEGYDATPES